MDLFKIIAWIPIWVLAFFASMVYVPVFVGHDPLIPYPESLNLFLTVAITSFAFVEGYSTYKQVVLSEDRNLIEDARNELEKAYGPLYSVLNKQSLFNNKLLISSEEKKELDRIMATYPFMFSDEINNRWREKIQKLEQGNIDGATLRIEEYQIPSEFRAKINEEYEVRVKRYNKLLKK